MCLANSWKSRGRCVAGLEYVSNSILKGWIRPVSERSSQEVNEEERCYADGEEPELMDIIEITMKKHQPHEYQQENWLIDDQFYWQKEGAFPISALEPFAKTSGPLWTSGDSSQVGKNDRVRYSYAKAMSHSLLLIRVESLLIRMTWRRGSRGTKSGQIGFSFGGIEYALRLTDPVMFNVNRHLRVGESDGVELGPHYLTISLGEPFNQYCYKLVAAAIPCN